MSYRVVSWCSGVNVGVRIVFSDSVGRYGVGVVAMVEEGMCNPLFSIHVM